MFDTLKTMSISMVNTNCEPSAEKQFFCNYRRLKNAYIIESSVAAMNKDNKTVVFAYDLLKSHYLTITTQTNMFSLVQQKENRLVTIFYCFSGGASCSFLLFTFGVSTTS